jgi:hypothetical protein
VAAALAVPALGGGERVLAGLRAGLTAAADRARVAAHRHAGQLGVLHAQLSGPAADRRMYPGLEALAT